MTNVVSLSGALAGEPCERVIDLLERVLEQAKAGQIEAVGVAFQTSDGGAGADFKSRTDASPIPGTAIGLLSHRYFTQMDDPE